MILEIFESWITRIRCVHNNSRRQNMTYRFCCRNHVFIVYTFFGFYYLYDTSFPSWDLCVPLWFCQFRIRHVLEMSSTHPIAPCDSFLLFAHMHLTGTFSGNMTEWLAGKNLENVGTDSDSCVLSCSPSGLFSRECPQCLSESSICLIYCLSDLTWTKCETPPPPTRTHTTRL